MLDACLEGAADGEGDAIRRWGLMESVLGGVVEDDGLGFRVGLEGTGRVEKREEEEMIWRVMTTNLESEKNTRKKQEATRECRSQPKYYHYLLIILTLPSSIIIIIYFTLLYVTLLYFYFYFTLLYFTLLYYTLLYSTC